MAIFIVVPARYLTHLFWQSISTTTKIVVGDVIDQVYTSGQVTGCCLLQLLSTTIALGFTQFLNKRLSAYLWWDIRLIVSRLYLVFFFRRFWSFFFVVGPPALSIASIYFLDTSKGLECYIGLGFNNFIIHFWPKSPTHGGNYLSKFE